MKTESVTWLLEENAEGLWAFVIQVGSERYLMSHWYPTREALIKGVLEAAVQAEAESEHGT
jgi:hypothetical protein